MRSALPVLALAAALVLAGCERTTDIDDVALGTDVQVTREDGGLVEGRLEQTSDEAVTVNTGTTTRLVPKNEIADVRVVTPDTIPEPPPRARFRDVMVPAGTTLAIVLRTPVSSETSQAADPVEGELQEPIIIDGVSVAPAGSQLSGAVTTASPTGKVQGRAALGVRFDRLVANDQSHAISAEFARTAPSLAESDAKKIGIPAIAGAAIGGIIGGKKGAAIGAAAGGGAGAAVVLTTAGEPVALDAGTVLSLTIGREIDVRVPIE
jgi:hypothetical protein